MLTSPEKLELGSTDSIGSERSILCESDCCRFLNAFKAPENGIGLVEAVSDHFRFKAYLFATRFGNNEYLRLGTVTDVVRRRECPFCRIVTSAIDIVDHAVENVMYVLWDEPHAAFKVKTMPKSPSPPLWEIGVRIVLCGGSAYPEPTIYWARIANINGFDSNQVKLWLSTCMDRHESKCGLDSTKFEENMRSLEDQGFRLIDVLKDCVVVAPRQSRYLALSYVWSRVEQFKLQKHSCATLAAPGSLAEHRDRMSKTIRDAMYFVSVIGERYLWVDALCLVQDDPQSMVAGIQSMNCVFQNAIATIVAADGSDSTVGLRRLHSRLASNSQRVETIKPGFRLMAIGALDVYLKRAKWSSRAWTFQEQILSRRTIIFVNEQVYFRCRHCTWSEDTFADRFPDRSFDAGLQVSLLPACASEISSSGNLNADAEPLSWLIIMLLCYTQRELTYATDAVRAVSGLLRVVSASMKSEMVQGLPVVALDYMLTFQVHSNQHWQSIGKIKPRKVKRRRDFPSWSWAGWEASIGWMRPCTEVSPIYPKPFNHWLDHGTWIVWFKSLGLNPPIAILTDESLQAHSRNEREICYRRTSQGDLSGRFGKLDTSRTVPDALTSINPAYLHQQLLRFYTVTVNLTISSKIPRSKSWPSGEEKGEQFNNQESTHSAALYDIEGMFSGLLKFDMAGFVTEDHVYELILLSDCKNSLFLERDLPDMDLSNPFVTYQGVDEEWKLFWVMLLIWNDGVAERRGLGQILRSSVEKSFPPGPQWKEIVLG